LRVLAQEQGLNLTEVARRVARTPGSTRDYLRWLEEVDLIESREKRYYYRDPILRLWARIHGNGELASEQDIHREVDAHIVASGGHEPSQDEAFTFTFPPPPSDDFLEID
jgi:DNA-binding IclR family transcriptional regulator